jgi:hypothetical protein
VWTVFAGKTSTALAIARQLYGPELMKTRVMELNASDERGINVVRHKVRAQQDTTCSQLDSAARWLPYSRQQCVDTVSVQQIAMCRAST